MLLIKYVRYHTICGYDLVTAITEWIELLESLGWVPFNRISTARKQFLKKMTLLLWERKTIYLTLNGPPSTGIFSDIWSGCLYLTVAEPARNSAQGPFAIINYNAIECGFGNGLGLR